jgi:hypothetical protein
MSVEVISVHRRYEITVQIHVKGAEPRPGANTGVGRTYLPTRVAIVYRWTSDDTDQAADVTLSGRRVLKNDALGAVVHQPLWTRDDWPEWVRALVEGHRPPADAFAGRTP